MVNHILIYSQLYFTIQSTRIFYIALHYKALLRRQPCIPLTKEIRLKILGSPDLTVFLLDLMGFLVQIYLISHNIHPKESSLCTISSFCGQGSFTKERPPELLLLLSTITTTSTSTTFMVKDTDTVCVFMRDMTLS